MLKESKTKYNQFGDYHFFKRVFQLLVERDVQLFFNFLFEIAGIFPLIVEHFQKLSDDFSCIAIGWIIYH